MLNLEAIKHATLAFPIYEAKEYCNALSEAVLDGGIVISSGFNGGWWAVVQYPTFEENS